MSSPTPSHEELGSGGASDLRRSVTQATDRIHSIIDEAERTAAQIRVEAERQAAEYLADRRREADRLFSERSAALDDVGRRLGEAAERFRAQADEMLSELDVAITEAKGSTTQTPPSGSESLGTELRRATDPHPDGRRAAPMERPVAVAAYPGTAANRPEPVPSIDPTPSSASPDETAEAMLRATQLAVSGRDRGEIERALRESFPAVDPGPVLDEILG